MIIINEIYDEDNNMTYLEAANAYINYYKNVISKSSKDSFYLGLYMATQIKRIICSPSDKEEIELLYLALKSQLTNRQGTQWIEMFDFYEKWKNKLNESNS